MLLIFDSILNNCE